MHALGLRTIGAFEAALAWTSNLTIQSNNKTFKFYLLVLFGLHYPEDYKLNYFYFSSFFYYLDDLAKT